MRGLPCVLRGLGVHPGAGLVVGLALAAWLGRRLVALLVGVQPWEPGVQAVVVAELLLAGSAASLGPALRAPRLNPTEALPHE